MEKDGNYRPRPVDDFRDEFKGWTQDMFKVPSKWALKIIRLHLTTHGVWIRRDPGVSPAKGLYDCLQEDTQHEWSKEEIEAHLEIHPDDFNSGWNPARVQSRSNQPATGRATILSTLNHPTSSTAEAQIDDHIHPQPRYYRSEQDRQDRTLLKRIVAIARHYTNADDKYGGDVYDDLNTKLLKFYDICDRFGLQEHQYNIVFSLMLKEKAEKFYLTKVKGVASDVPAMLGMIRAHFYTEETCRRSLTEWNKTTLPRIIARNPTKTRSACHEILFETLEKIQRGLYPLYQSEADLREQTIYACRGVKECQFSIFRPASTLDELQADLRSEVAINTLPP
ncbi:hypothetical protein N7461_003464 [Penicillium sp. DV-2018c]|nr:hypothetical protein N7461_003464 [Penicillium sp. DV-2018c]